MNNVMNSIYFQIELPFDFEKELLFYNKMKYTIFRWLVKKRVRFKDKQELIQFTFWNWYYLLKDMELHYPLAMNCINDAVNLYFSYLTQKDKRKPNLYSNKISVTLTPNKSFNLDLENTKLRVFDYELKILNLNKDIKQLKDFEIRKARLIKRKTKWYLEIVFNTRLTIKN